MACARTADVGGFQPGNGIVAQALLFVLILFFVKIIALAVFKEKEGHPRQVTLRSLTTFL